MRSARAGRVSIDVSVVVLVVEDRVLGAGALVFGFMGAGAVLLGGGAGGGGGAAVVPVVPVVDGGVLGVVPCAYTAPTASAATNATADSEALEAFMWISSTLMDRPNGRLGCTCNMRATPAGIRRVRRSREIR